MLLVKRHYETLMRSFDCAVLELDEEGRILMANAGAAKILEKKEQGLIGETLPSFFPPGDRRTIQDLLDELRKARLPEDLRMTASLQKRQVSLRLGSSVEEGKCAGIVVSIESKPPGAENEK
jgi:PAS domain S-box-containing protein